MKPLRTLSIALVSALILGLSACGGGGEGDGDFGDSDDPTQVAPTVYITNGASSTMITKIWAYEAYTGNLFSYDIALPAGSTSAPLPGLVASQYDFYVYFSNGHRSDDAMTYTDDPYNGTSITRRIPRVNPGEVAEVDFNY